MDFELNEEQRMVRAAMQDFAKKEGLLRYLIDYEIKRYGDDEELVELVQDYLK